MNQPFRLDPAMGVGSYKTYSIRQPKTAQTRIGTCEQAGCEAWEFGWRTIVPAGSAQADYIRAKSGRRFTETVENGICTFTFHPGQKCFGEHHVLDRPQFYLVRDGDWRGNPTGRQRMHTTGDYWVEDFAEHQAKLADQIEKG
jgi:hypothetical protein